MQNAAPVGDLKFRGWRFLWKSWGEKYGESWSSEFLGSWTLMKIWSLLWGSFQFQYRHTVLESCILQVFLNLHFKMQMFCWCFHFTVPKSQGATEDDQTSLQFQQLVQQPVHPKTSTRHQGTGAKGLRLGEDADFRWENSGEQGDIGDMVRVARSCPPNCRWYGQR